MRQMNPSSDKVPSRVGYQIQRLLLAKSVALFLRIFVPVVGIAGGAFGLLKWSGFDLQFNDVISQVQKEVKYNPEFMIGGVIVRGASPDTEREIRALLPTGFPISPFDIDVETLKQEVEKLPAAASASVSMNPSGYMEIAVIEHEPALIWRNELDLHLLDAEGRIIGSAGRRLDYPDLMLVAGSGSTAAAAEAIQIMSTARPIGKMIRGLVRVGERRWDVVLDRSRKIMLPEKEPAAALAKLIYRNNTDGILSREISAVDLRNPERMTVRLAESEVEPSGALDS